VYAQQLDAIEVSVQALRGNEVKVVVLSYRNPSVLTKSFMLIEQSFINYSRYASPQMERRIRHLM
jgi:hypothetical protein